MNGEGGRGKERKSETERDRQTDRERARETDRQTDRQNETDRQTDREKRNSCCFMLSQPVLLYQGKTPLTKTQ